MNKPPAFQFYADDFLGGVATMSNDEVGLYIRLLAIQWGKGFVTDDDIARLGKGMAEPSLCYVKSKFKVGDDSNLRNDRLELERKKQAEFRESRAKAGKAGADSRWHSHSTAIAQPMANDSSPSPSPSPNKKTGEQLKVEKLFNKKESTPWDASELRAWKIAEPLIKATPDSDFEDLRQFYAAPQQETFSRKTLATLLNNWNGEIEKAKNWKSLKSNPPRIVSQQKPRSINCNI